MARGGHHGGGFHGGGHHFGGFHGGGFGGGYHGGYHGGGGYYNGDDDDFGLLAYKIRGVIFGGVVLCFFAVQVAEGEWPGLNLINLGMFAFSILLFVLGLKEYKRTSALYKLNGQPVSENEFQVWHADYKNYGPASVSDKVSWFGKYEKKYRIAFYDRDFGDENIRKIRELMQRTPWIVWMNSFVWLVIGIICTISNLFFYEAVIPVFENMIMTDEAFAFIDDFVFYLPAGLTLLSALSCFVLVKVRDSLLYKCAMRIVEDNNAAYEKMKTENFIAARLSTKWYYNNCPNCGADAKTGMRFCNHCGTSLEVKDISKEPVSSVHRISSEAENNGKVTTIKR